MFHMSRNFNCYKADITGKRYLIGELVLYANGEYDFNFNNSSLVKHLKWINIGNDEFSLSGLRAIYPFFKMHNGLWESVIEGFGYYLSENSCK